MVKRIKPPVRLRIFGRMRDIVDVRPDRFTEREASGRLVHHIGHLALEQEPAWLIDEARPCSVCKRPCRTTTKLGRAVHMWCEKRWTVLPDDVIAGITYGVAADLGAEVMAVRDSETDRYAATERTRAERDETRASRARTALWRWREADKRRR